MPSSYAIIERIAPRRTTPWQQAGAVREPLANVRRPRPSTTMPCSQSDSQTRRSLAKRFSNCPCLLPWRGTTRGDEFDYCRIIVINSVDMMNYWIKPKSNFVIDGVWLSNLEERHYGHCWLSSINSEIEVILSAWACAIDGLLGWVPFSTQQINEC
eukprot:scaffold4877_cov171-Ochromonas_danica.AAC.16